MIFVLGRDAGVGHEVLLGPDAENFVISPACKRLEVLIVDLGVELARVLL